MMRRAIRTTIRRALVALLILAGIAAAASIIWRYNAFVYRKALGEAPAPVQRVIKKVVEIPLTYKVDAVKWFTFAQPDSLREWEEKVFKGRVVYVVEDETCKTCPGAEPPYVRAESKAAASAMYYKIKLDAVNKHPVISWKWRVNAFPVKASPEVLETEREHDFAGRVYVIFPVGFITNWKVLEYLWSETLPVGSSGTSPYSKNIKLTVVRSGKPKDGEWAVEERDIREDYKKAFGREPERDIGAVAFMTNTEHTGSAADAYYDEIRIGYREDEKRGGAL